MLLIAFMKNLQEEQKRENSVWILIQAKKWLHKQESRTKIMQHQTIDHQLEKNQLHLNISNNNNNNATTLIPKDWDRLQEAIFSFNGRPHGFFFSIHSDFPISICNY